ncbi:WD40-repeat-containing domain protein [Phascolomyces articulosus]|uniref:WD40-repeat-containing domain protein n=1 Tax=Phascolomyces articulosus TaxID=60185 RepID=A0AAD5K540_9FUNG|nr:WD40-repeat-containing domain protein [Phascolomyces articulosus]
MVTAFDDLNPDTKSTILLELLKRSSTNTLQLVSSLIIPTLRRDFLSSLPKEISLCVLSYLDIHTLCRASIVCRSWRDLINGDALLWKRRMIQDGFKHDDPWASKFRGAMPLNDDSSSSSSSLSSFPSPSSSEQTPLPNNGNDNDTRPALKTVTNPYKERYRRLYTLRQNWRKGRVRTARLITHPQNVVTCLSVDEEKIVSGADDSLINIYDATTLARRRCLRGHEGGVWALQHVGNTLVSGSTDRTVRVWNLLTGKCTHVFYGHTSTVRCLQIVMPNKNNEPKQPLIIAGSRDSTLRVWRLPDPQKDPPYDGATANHGPSSAPPTTTNSTTTMAASSAANANPYHLYTLTGHTNSVRAIAAHGNILVSGSYDRKVRVWDLSKGTLIHRMEGHGEKVYSVVIDPERNQCMSGSMDATVKIWSLETGQCLRTLDGHSILVGLLGLSKDHLVSAAADTTLRVWSPQGDCMHALLGHQGAITCFQHDHEKIISGSEGGLKLWDIKTGKLLQNFVTYATGVWRVAFDQRQCVAAIHSNNITYLEVLDFGSHGLEEAEAHEASITRPVHATKY